MRPRVYSNLHMIKRRSGSQPRENSKERPSINCYPGRSRSIKSLNNTRRELMSKYFTYIIFIVMWLGSQIMCWNRKRHRGIQSHLIKYLTGNLILDRWSYKDNSS